MAVTPIKAPGARSIVLTKTQAATRQLEAAIEAFQRGEYDIAITLAGAAEDMLNRKGLLDTMNEHRLAKFLHGEKRWFPFINRERNWLKHKRGTCQYGN